MSVTLGEIAEYLELELHGDKTITVDSIAPIHSAKSHQLSFVVGSKFLDELKVSEAGVVIVAKQWLEFAPGNALVSSDPYLSYAKVSQYLYPSDIASPAKQHPTAVIHDTANVAESANIAANVVIEKNAVIGEHCVIGAGCVIGQGSVIGDHCTLFANVTIYHGCRLGKYCRVQSGAIIGGEGFGYAPSSDGWIRINQIGGVSIADKVEIGANTTIDRGAIGDTVIDEGVILDNQIQIAHNVRIGKFTAIAGCSAVAGSTTIGSRCTIAGAVSIVGHLTIVDNVHLTATSFVMRSITEPGAYSSGLPLETNKKWHRTFARITQLDAMATKLRLLKGFLK